MPPPTPGGIRALLATLLSSRLSEIVSLAAFDSGEPPDYVPGEVGVRRVAVMMRQLWRFYRTLRQNRPDVAHIHLPGGTGLAKASLFVAVSRLRKVPTISHLHFWPSELSLFGSRRAEKWMVKLLGWSDAIVTVSDELAAYLRPLLPPHKLIKVMPNCVELDSWLSLEKLPPRQDKLQLLFVGTVGKRKGVFELVQAFAASEARATTELVVMGGDGGDGELDRLRNLAEQLQVTKRCQILGPVYGEEKKQIFMNSDIFLLPSYAEGQPVTILEAMAAGLPIISTKVGAIPDVVQDGTSGLIIEPGDIPALTRAIDQLVSDHALRRQMEQSSRQRAYQYDVKPYLEQLHDLYTHVAPTV